MWISCLVTLCLALVNLLEGCVGVSISDDLFLRILDNVSHKNGFGDLLLVTDEDVLNLTGTPLKYDTVAQFPCDLDGAFAVYINSKKQELLNVIMWCDKNTTEKMIELAYGKNRRYILRRPVLQWVIFNAESTDLDFVWHGSMQDTFLIFSQVKVAKENSDNNGNECSSCYDVMVCNAPCRTGTFLNVAMLNGTGHTIQGTIPSIPSHFTNFEGRHVIYSNSLQTLFTKYKDSNGTQTLKGISVEAMDFFSEILNFSYSFQQGKYGPVINGTDYGMIGELMNEKTDLIIGAMAQTHQRSLVIDYMQPYGNAYYGVLLKASSENFSYFVSQFSLNVWWTFAAIHLLTALVLSCILLFDKNIVKANDGNTEKANGVKSIFVHTFWSCFGLACHQGFPKFHNMQSYRVVVYSAWLLGIVFIGIYTGNLVAALSTMTVNLPFNTLKEFTAQEHVKPLYSKNGLVESLLKNSHSEPLRKIWLKYNDDRNTDRPKSRLERLERVNTGRYAYMTGTSFEMYRKMYNYCDLTWMSEYFYQTPKAWAMPKGSPFRKRFNKLVLSMLETGLFSKWTKMYQPKGYRNCDGYGSSPAAQRTVTLSDVRNVTFLLVVGLVCAAFTFLMEMIVKKTMDQFRGRNMIWPL